MRYTEHFEVFDYQVDINDNIRPSELVRLLQETADHQMRDRGPTYEELFFQGKAFILTRMNVEILEPLHQYDRIDVDTWRCPAKGATFPRCHEIKKEGRTVVRALSEWAVSDPVTGKLWKVADVDISNYEMEEPHELPLPKRFRYDRDLEFEELDPFRVRYSFTDMNRHMNNANYHNMLWERIPDVENREVTSLNIRFMAEAPLGADIQIGMAKVTPEFAGDASAEEVFAFRTEVNGRTNVELLIGVRQAAQGENAVQKMLERAAKYAEDAGKNV